MRLLLTFSVVVMALGCGDDVVRVDADTSNPIVDGGFVCFAEESEACIGTVHYTCERDGEFLASVEEDCAEMDQICVPGIWCSVCRPDTITCRGNDVVQCDGTGDEFDVLETCDPEEGLVCRDGSCQDLCAVAIADKSYQGCEFYSADLDNAAIGAGRDASAQQYAIVVSNPSALATDVWIEVDDSAVGGEQQLREVERVRLAPGDLEVFELPRREVDGSSSNQLCSGIGDTCSGSEVCVCAGERPPCFCRISEDASGLNDGTHTALTRQGYRVQSTLPIIAYQFNPLDNVGVFSNDASLLLPTSAIGTNYTVVGWPQTIADADCDTSDPACLDIDFDPNNDDEDLRAFLTIMGTAPGTQVEITMGGDATTVVGGGSIPASGPGDVINVELSEFDVLNLETAGLNSDFTGTQISASAPVSVFVGSEASDAPRFETYPNRVCCADHLEEQLFSDSTLGTGFMIARMPPRTAALNDAFLDPTRDSVAEVNEPEYVRIAAVFDGVTEITTTLPPPDDRITLNGGESIIIPARQDFLMNSLGGRPIAVLQTLPSQQALGIPNYYPGGDPAIVAIPPTQQYRRDYVFLTPDKYAFDFVTITAQADTEILLDDEPLDPLTCSVSPADGITRRPGDPAPQQVIYRCQLSFPDVDLGCDPRDEDCQAGVRDGLQNDGVHTVVATDPVGVVVYGFDAFVSYAYAAGLNLRPIPR